MVPSLSSILPTYNGLGPRGIEVAIAHGTSLLILLMAKHLQENGGMVRRGVVSSVTESI